MLNEIEIAYNDLESLVIQARALSACILHQSESNLEALEADPRLLALPLLIEHLDRAMSQVEEAADHTASTIAAAFIEAEEAAREA